MSNPFTFYQHGTATPFSSLSFGKVAAGSVSSTLTADVWWNKGTNGGKSGKFRIRLFQFDGTKYVDSGLQALDRRWIQARIRGVVRTGDSTQAAYFGPWQGVGSNGADLECPSISGNCAHVVDFRFAPGLTSGAATETDQFTVQVIASDVTTTYPLIFSHFPHGIVTGIGDLTLSEWVLKPTVSDSGADVTTGARDYLAAGVQRHEASHVYTFNGTAADGALASGQEYQAVISQPLSGGNEVITKGNKAAAGSSVTPDLPANSLFITVATVPFGVASVALSGTIYSGRGLVEIDSGLDGHVCPVRILMGGAPWDSGEPLPFTLNDDSDNYVWAGSGGLVVVTTTATPATVGDFPLWFFTAASGSVTVPTDLRRYIGSRVSYPTHAASLELDCGIAERFDWKATDDETVSVVNVQPKQMIELNVQSNGTDHTLTFGTGFSSVANLSTTATDGAISRIVLRGADDGSALVEVISR